MEIAANLPLYPGQQRFVMDEATQVGEARRAAQSLANFEFTAEVAGKVAIVATELATNLLRHAGGGELLLQRLGHGDDTVIELLAVDKGPGMSDVALCLRDGYSTGGTAGTGLGAVRRLADGFEAFSRPGEGTVVLARFGAVERHGYGVVNLALEGEIHCGDAWHLVQGPSSSAAMVVDGLGHGTFAADAARVAIDSFAASPFLPPQETLTRAHSRMSGTRGGAAACAVFAEGRLSYAGIGNIAATLVSAGRSQGLVSHNGTLGLGQRRVQQFEYSYEPGALLVMHSDGISGRFDLRTRDDLRACHPAIVAAVLYRDHSRGRDDATVLVVPA